MVPARAAYPLGAAVTLADLEDDPHPTLAALRQHEPVSWVPVLDGWLVTRYELAVRVLRDPDAFTVQDERFSTAQVVGPSMLSLDGRDHERHRAPFAPSFRPAAVRAAFTDAVEEECARILSRLVGVGACELRREFAGPLAAGVLARALGLPADEAGIVRGWYESIVAAVTELTAGRALPPAGARAFEALTARLSQTTAAVGNKAASGATKPAASDRPLLATAGDAAHGTLTLAELISNAAVLLFGGIETTEAMIANATLHLLSEPAALVALRDGPAPNARVLQAVLEESLRLEPAAAMLDRYATSDVELGGSSIHAGDLVRVSLAAAGRDPAVFEDPDRLIVEPPRPRRHLAFAQGPHVCIGVHLARLEARIALWQLLEQLPGLRLDPDRPTEIRGLVFRKPPELWVRWD